LLPTIVTLRGSLLIAANADHMYLSQDGRNLFWHVGLNVGYGLSYDTNMILRMLP
jgi:hypothetical protein